jgi:hypothetical protein
MKNVKGMFCAYMILVCLLFATTAFSEPPVKKGRCRTCALAYGNHVSPVRYSVSDYSAPDAIVWVEYYPGSPWLQHSSFLGKNCIVNSVFTLEGVECASIRFTNTVSPYVGAVWSITFPCAKLVKL